MSIHSHFTSFHMPLFAVTCDSPIPHIHMQNRPQHTRTLPWTYCRSKHLQMPSRIPSYPRIPATIDIPPSYTPERTENQQHEKQQHSETSQNPPPSTTMDNRNTPAAPAAPDAALYDANITIVALQQQLAASEAATLRAQQVAQDRADEAELHQATIRQLRVEVRDAEARSMPSAPRPAHARLVLPVADGSSVHQEVLVLRAENRALREQLLREMALRLELRFVFFFWIYCSLRSFALY
jgi:hypothetical protein